MKEKDMMKEKISKLAGEYGFADAVLTGQEAIRVVPEYRAYCEENLCGNYGKNYSCPPYSGTVAEMKARTEGYEHVLVFCTKHEHVDAFDPFVAGPLKKDHSARSILFLKELKKQGLVGEGLAMLAGPCSLCDSCKMKEDKPCPFPKQRASCLSAYAIDVAYVAEIAGIPLSWDLDQVTYFSLYFF